MAPGKDDDDGNLQNRDSLDFSLGSQVQEESDEDEMEEVETPRRRTLGCSMRMDSQVLIPDDDLERARDWLNSPWSPSKSKI